MLTVVLCVVAVVAGWWLLFPSSRYRRLGNLIPGPAPWPIVGNALHFHGTGVRAVECWREYQKKYGSVFRVWIGFGLHVVLSDPEDVQMLLSSQKLIAKGFIYYILKDWLGTGLLLSEGELWQKRRKAITPTFHFKVLDDFVPIFNKCADTLIKCLSDKADKGTFDMAPFVSNCALDSVSESAMGIKVEAQTKPKSDYVKSVCRMTELLGDKGNKPWLGLEPIYSLTGRKAEERQRLQCLHSLTREVLEQKKTALKKTSNNQDQSNEFGIKKRMAFLELLLNMKNLNNPALKSDQDILDEVTTFMFEGQDTTTSALTFTLWLLGKHPDVQETVYKEVHEIFSSDCDLSMEDLGKMKYLERVIKEALRLFPPVPLIARKLEEDIVLPSSGQTVPAGTDIYVFILLVQRNPKIFPDPDKFDPDRFLNEHNRHPYSYIPFSAGPRNCIGQKFAMLELKTVISKVVYNYIITSDEDVVLDPEIILRSANGAKVKITKRTKE